MLSAKALGFLNLGIFGRKSPVYPVAERFLAGRPAVMVRSSGFCRAKKAQRREAAARNYFCVDRCDTVFNLKAKVDGRPMKVEMLSGVGDLDKSQSLFFN